MIPDQFGSLARAPPRERGRHDPEERTAGVIAWLAAGIQLFRCSGSRRDH